jgi:PAS domain S-box-containing protein
MMPEINGIDFLKILRAKGSSIPFILLTGRGREDVAVQALNLGADFYVEKHGDPKTIFAELANATKQCVEKRASLESLMEAQNRFESFMDHSPTISFIKDLQGQYVFVNREYEIMLNIRKEDIVGRTDLDLWPKAAAESFREADKRITSSGIGEKFSEVIEQSDGVHAYLTFKFPLVNSKGKDTLLGGVSFDVTDMKMYESALELANTKLGILGDLTRHDAINQVSVLEGWLSLLKEDECAAGLRNHLETMTVATKTLREQLEFAGEYEDVGADNQAWTDIQEACVNVWGKMAVDDIMFECQCSGFEVLVDPMFPKVIRNLVDNTVRHGEGAEMIRIFCQETPDGLRLVYEDDGAGIASEAKVKIFDKGFGTNSGFCLYLIRELLRISDARLREVGEHGKGVRFEIDFPEGRYRRKMASEKG